MKIPREEVLKILDELEEELLNESDLIPNAIAYAKKYGILTGEDLAKRFTI